MVWHFYVLTISIVSDTSFRESPLQTGVKTDSFTGISSKEQVNQQRERAFQRDTKLKETLNLACDYFTYVGARSFMRKFSCKMSQNEEIHRATIARPYWQILTNQTTNQIRKDCVSKMFCTRGPFRWGWEGGGQPGGPVSMCQERKSCPCPIFLLRWRWYLCGSSFSDICVV